MNGDRGLIVVVEDEPAIVALQRLYLARAGYTVHAEAGGEHALDVIRRLRPAAVILDIALPGADGIEICRAMRAADDWTPVVFVTARDDEVDRVLGLELGADDYLTKPFSPRELVARVRALIRRAQHAQSGSVRRAGAVVLDALRRTVLAGDRRVQLTATEFDLLDHLMRQPGRVFTRSQLLSAVWGVADYGTSRTVDAHIAQLRTKLGPASPIRTVRGVGYCVQDDPDPDAVGSAPVDAVGSAPTGRQESG